MIARNARSVAVVVVGGGVIGSSIALELRQRLRGAEVMVVERDPTYARASSRLATGGVRQQYGSALNVAMARYGIAFYRRFDQLTAACGERSRAWFRQRGYLFLADEANADRLEQRYRSQRAAGASVERWTASQVAKHVPGLATHDVLFALFGPEDGYLDPREVLGGFRAMAASAGVTYVHGMVSGIELAGGRVAGVRVQTDAGEHEIASPVVVNAAGAYAAAVGRAAGVTLPVDPVRQHLFRLELDAAPEPRIPMVFDP
ncbi:MAG TPA: FAD-dependent oxidoreductase, partial [Gemmatimonadaceae bacterium]